VQDGDHQHPVPKLLPQSECLSSSRSSTSLPLTFQAFPALGSDIAESSVEAKLRQAREAVFVARGANQKFPGEDGTKGTEGVVVAVDLANYEVSRCCFNIRTSLSEVTKGS